jgi:hypothetical protein
MVDDDEIIKRRAKRKHADISVDVLSEELIDLARHLPMPSKSV